MRSLENTGGITDKLFKGQFGKVRVALQYACHSANGIMHFLRARRWRC